MSGRHFLLALAMVTSVVTGTQAAPRLVATRSAPALPAWSEFCEQHALECALDSAEPEVILLVPDTLELIESVNRYVNHAIAPRGDIDHWGKIDHWDLPTDGQGDCEDYQLLKRKLLVEAGLPRRALRMTVVIDDTGQGHAVLTLRTAAGDLILDNKVDAVLPAAEVGYEFIKRESSNAVEWLFLEPEAQTAVAAMAHGDNHSSTLQAAR
jgi:predicted transglutaminase-like cysteine proteinase